MFIPGLCERITTVGTGRDLSQKRPVPKKGINKMKQRKSNRLKGYDYSKDNLYFVTSCVHDMFCCFGDIVVRTGRVGTGRVQALHSVVYTKPSPRDQRRLGGGGWWL